MKHRHNEDRYNESESTLLIYSEGSGIEGQIGAAAYSLQLSQMKHLHLGMDKLFNVYIAELSAIDLAIDIAYNTPQTFTKCQIYTDSQAAIKATTKPDQQSGQTILYNAITKIEKLSVEKGMTIEIAWIPGHMDIEGNDKADKAAKGAALSKGVNPSIPKIQQPPLKASRSNCIKQATKTDWNTSWRNKKSDSKILRKITTKCNVNNTLKIYNTITKRNDLA